MSLSILSYERYAALLRPTKADSSDFRRAWLCVTGSWLYSLVWTLPPFLGWSSYGPEGAGTSCSVQWQLRSASSVSYVVCLFIFCLFLPLMLMIFCYGKILLIIKGVSFQLSNILIPTQKIKFLDQTPKEVSSKHLHVHQSSLTLVSISSLFQNVSEEIKHICRDVSKPVSN